MSSQAGLEKLWQLTYFWLAEVYECGKSGVNTKDVEKAIARWMAPWVCPFASPDGGPQFKGEAFKEFCRRWGILHDPSSPYHHIANGYAEAAVKR
ncbi:Enzymatic polyprotein [Caligus rogercresseyi]|uniref:Enzymatic polyprotein n=1 Tax=Caligus rogercresseyi TaxID=217165 RepID=A0A7T8QT57_CALRO|nr:Enzymatic polyprotein [Caligus rogercresseyi]